MSLRLGANRLVQIDPIKTGSQPYLQFCIILIIYETPRQGWLADGFRFTSNASRNFRVQIALCPLSAFCLWPYEDISGSCDCLYFFWCCKASVVSTESTRRIRNDVANAAVRPGGENESRILDTVSTESACVSLAQNDPSLPQALCSSTASTGDCD